MLTLKSPSSNMPGKAGDNAASKTSATPATTTTQNGFHASTPSSTTATNSASNPHGSCVLKSGYMKKLKTMKKKYFVLSRSESGDIFLQYFDSQKKYEANSSRPKRSINIRNCFAINKRIIGDKNSYAIAIYTFDDSFIVVLDDEQEMKKWLDTLVQQKASNSISNGSAERDAFDHVWQVTVVKKALAVSQPHLIGVQRLCLTPHMLYMYKVEVGAERASKPQEFPLNAIRKCGHSDSYFCIEFGRSSSTGPGDLWMLADEAAIAHHMHENIRDAMKASKAEVVDVPVSKVAPGRSGSVSDCSSPGSVYGTSYGDSHMSMGKLYEPADSYLEMTPGSSDITSKLSAQTSGDEQEYLDMAPLSSSLPNTPQILGSASPREMIHVSQVYTIPCFQSPPRLTNVEFPLAKVKSYFSPSEEDSRDFIKPARAYSMGSRPQNAARAGGSSRSAAKQHAQAARPAAGAEAAAQDPYTYVSPDNVQPSRAVESSPERPRTRAHSVGSQMSHARERLKTLMKPARSALSTNKLFEGASGHESGLHFQSGQAPDAHRARSSTCGSRIGLLPVKGDGHGVTTITEDLMEIDYTSKVSRRSSQSSRLNDTMSRSTSSELSSIQPPPTSVSPAPLLLSPTNGEMIVSDKVRILSIKDSSPPIEGTCNGDSFCYAEIKFPN